MRENPRWVENAGLGRTPGIAQLPFLPRGQEIQTAGNGMAQQAQWSVQCDAVSGLEDWVRLDGLRCFWSRATTWLFSVIGSG